MNTIELPLFELVTAKLPLQVQLHCILQWGLPTWWVHINGIIPDLENKNSSFTLKGSIKVYPAPAVLMEGLLKSKKYELHYGFKEMFPTCSFGLRRQAILFWNAGFQSEKRVHWAWLPSQLNAAFPMMMLPKCVMISSSQHIFSINEQNILHPMRMNSLHFGNFSQSILSPIWWHCHINKCNL